MLTTKDNNDSLIIPSATEMIYYTYDGNFQLECESKILFCQFIDDDDDKNENNNNDNDNDTDKNEQQQQNKPRRQTVHVCLDRTVLHAQGGGQPTDIGTLVTDSNNNDEGGAGRRTEIVITKVLLDRTTGVATHMGHIDNYIKNDYDDDKNNNIKPTTITARSSNMIGQKVKVIVDSNNRKILSECHTAGHVVDMAMSKVFDDDNIMPPTKAYHFLDGPYVEYKGSISINERKDILTKLQIIFQQLIDDDIATEICNVSLSEAEIICHEVADKSYFQLTDQFKNDTDIVRIVRVAGWPCPCGGTHVKSTGELKPNSWGIIGFKCKKGVVRVKYGQQQQKEI